MEPVSKRLNLPEDPLVSAAHRLSVLMGTGVPLEDYARSVEVLLLELSKCGLGLRPSAGGIPNTDGDITFDKPSPKSGRSHPRADRNSIEGTGN